MTEYITLTNKEIEKLEKYFGKKEKKELTELEKIMLKLKENKGEFHFAFEETNKLENFHELVPNMKKQYEFELDTFQKQAIYHMELGEHVFVIAHTSAGKTATAEYAISMAQSKGMKAIYTSPIKALSNQKYYDFRKLYGQVGIITGDVRIESENDIVTIMTTEILRSKLYQDMKFIDEVDWVIFDEVHYVNDEERGVVWEEVIMTIPKHVKLLMLSATVENAMNFAEWIGRTKQQKVCLVKTLHRPVPLEHFVFSKKREQIPSKLVLFKKGETKFMDKDYEEIYKLIVPKFSRNRRERDQLHNVKSMNEIIDYLDADEKLPAVFFVFSRNLVMQYAQKLASESTFKVKIHKIESLFKEMTEGLVDSEKNLPQILEVKKLLMKGIGVHHAGLIPFLKEIVEVLFSNGDIKVLFATETFAMGVNMPAKTVIFPCVEKFDGNEFRFLKPGEYTQMAGRAGRRGKDAAGNVIVFPNKVLPSPKQMKDICCGAPDMMKSKFYITYWMMLNWICFGNNELTDQMMKSYSKIDLFQLSQRAKLAEEAKTKFVKYVEDKCSNPNCDHEGLKIINKEIFNLKYQISQFIVSIKTDNKLKTVSFNECGRVVKFKNEINRRFYGIIVEVEEFNACRVAYFEGKNSETMKTERIPFQNLLCIFQKVFKMSGSDIYSESILGANKQKREQLCSRLQSFKQNKMSEPLFNPYKSPKIQKPKFYEDMLNELQNNLKLKKSSPANSCKFFKNKLQQNKKENELEKLANDIIDEFEMNKNQLEDELKKRIQLLKHFNFIDDDELLTLKGNVAKEMVSTDGLILTNMIFDGKLNQLPIHDLASIFSVFVFEPRNESQQERIDLFKPETQQLIDMIESYANEIVEKEEELKTEYTITKYVKLNYGLMEGVGLWALKKPFDEVIEASDTTEGLIIRCILRIQEVIEEVKRASILIGNEELEKKCCELYDLLRRDIVNVKSLYLRETSVVEGKVHIQGFKQLEIDTNDDFIANENEQEIKEGEEFDFNDNEINSGNDNEFHEEVDDNFNNGGNEVEFDFGDEYIEKQNENEEVEIEF